MAIQEAAAEGTPRAVFGAMLRFYRTKAGLTQDQLAAVAHVSGKLISSYESGWRVPTRETTADLDGTAELGSGGALVALWDQFEEGMRYQANPIWFQDWSVKEAIATRLRFFQPNLVPGLLQTRDYAAAVYATQFGISEDEIEERVAARLRRQEILTREQPPVLWVILDEWVLRRPVGGRLVILEQVNRLIEAAKRPTTRIEIISASAGAHTGLNAGGFALADLPDGSSIGYQEGQLRGLPIAEQKELAALALKWDTLSGETLPRRASLALLEESAKSWTSPA